MLAKPFLSHSQSSCALECGAKWWAIWHLGYQPIEIESMPQRIGTLGHAYALDDVQALWNRTVRMWNGETFWRIANERKWLVDDIPDVEYECARGRWAAYNLDRFLGLQRHHLLPDIYSRNPSGGPLAEVRIEVPWARVHEVLPMQDLTAAVETFSGIDGQPDLVTMESGPGGPATITDYKFRQKPDLAAATSEVPDTQGAWYHTLMTAAGLRPAGGLEFRQISVYAGPMLTVDDFLKPGSPYVTQRGLPSREPKNVEPQDFDEAFRLLVQRTTAERAAEGKRWSPTANDLAEARRHIEDLRHIRRVDERRFPLDPSVCREVVRDLMSHVDALLHQVRRGHRPARHLRAHPSSPCSRPFGCSVQGPCLASLGAHNFAEVLRSMSDDGRFSPRTDRIAEMPADMDFATAT